MPIVRLLDVSHDGKFAACVKESRQTLTMSTASIESLCAMAQTPTAKTLKFPQAKEPGTPAMHPLHKNTQFHTRRFQELCLTSQVRDVEVKEGA